MTRRSAACFEAAAAAAGLLHAMDVMSAQLPCQESRDALTQAGRVVAAIAAWSNAWGHAYAAHDDDRQIDPTLTHAEVSHA